MGCTPAGIDATRLARHFEWLGVGEILLTSLDRDGTYDGYDITKGTHVLYYNSISDLSIFFVKRPRLPPVL